ncbi:MAG: hypothetical protein AAGA50_13000 [Pseudomonadota bacterium]
MTEDIDTCLGLSDLQEDEGLLISIYRAWQTHGPTRSVAEHHIASSLRQDRIYGALEPLFGLFRVIGIEAADADRSALLSSHELQLLELLSPANDSLAPLFSIAEQCKAALAERGVVPRPASQITSSGHDRLTEIASLSYQMILR